MLADIHNPGNVQTLNLENIHKKKKNREPWKNIPDQGKVKGQQHHKRE